MHPITFGSVLFTYGAGLVFDASQGVATVAFLLLIYVLWSRKLERIRRKFDLSG